MKKKKKSQPNSLAFSKTPFRIELFLFRMALFLFRMALFLFCMAKGNKQFH